MLETRIIETKTCLYNTGYLGIIDLLIKNGAHVNDRNQYNQTPLIWAVEKGNFQTENLKMSK